jgi:hypothetical protein
MPVKKLSQITLAGSPPLTTDTVIGVGGGTTDLQYSLSQIATTVGGMLSLTINTTPIIGGTPGSILYDNAGTVGESALTSLIDTALGGTQGDILYRNATVWTVLPPGTSGYFLETQGPGANPQWAAGGSGITVNTTPITGGTSGRILYDNAGTVGESTLTGLIDALGSTQGDILYRNATVWTVLAPGTAGYVLQTGGPAANPSWVAAGTGITINATSITGGTSTHVLYDNAGTVGESANFVITSGNPNTTTTNAYYCNSKPALFMVPNVTADNWFEGEAGNTALTGYANFGTGTLALASLTSGNQNMAVGTEAAQSLTSGSGNVAIGFNALGSETTGGQNFCIGNSSAASQNGVNYTVAIGTSALNQNIDGSNNMAIGQQALAASQHDGNNLAIGYQSLVSLNGGSGNTAIGANTLVNLPTGSFNVAIGQSALSGLGVVAGGSDNLAIGRFALSNMQSGSGVTAMGEWRGAASVSNVIALSYGSNPGSPALDYNYTNSSAWTFAAPVYVPGAANPVLSTTSAVTSGAGASAGTLTNAPAAGNPTKWIPFNDNGTTRYFPAW